jgi:hypothetical protein
MLDVPAELAAIVRTQAVVVAVEGLGHDPLRAVGALVLELPGLSKRVIPRRSNVCFVSPTVAGRPRIHARVSSRSLNGEGVSRTSYGKKSVSTTTNLTGRTSPLGAF